jgi:hypothetical protein
MRGGPYESGRAAQDEQIRQSVDDVGGIELALDADHERLLGELGDDVECAEYSAVLGPVLDEIIGSRCPADDVHIVERETWLGCSGRRRTQDPSFSQSRLFFACFCGTLSPSRRQIRSTIARQWFARKPRGGRL